MYDYIWLGQSRPWYILKKQITLHINFDFYQNHNLEILGWRVELGHLQGCNLWVSQPGRGPGIKYWGCELHFGFAFNFPCCGDRCLADKSPVKAHLRDTVNPFKKPAGIISFHDQNCSFLLGKTTGIIRIRVLSKGWFLPRIYSFTVSFLTFYP